MNWRVSMFVAYAESAAWVACIVITIITLCWLIGDVYSARDITAQGVVSQQLGYIENTAGAQQTSLVVNVADCPYVLGSTKEWPDIRTGDRVKITMRVGGVSGFVRVLAVERER